MQCRSCLKNDSTYFVDMKAPTLDGLNFYDYFNECTQLGANVDDGLPSTMCLSCSQDLRTAYNFVKGAREVDATLRLILSNTYDFTKESGKAPLIGQTAEDVQGFADNHAELEFIALDPLEQKPDLEGILTEKIKREEPFEAEFTVDKDSDDEPLIRSVKRRRISSETSLGLLYAKSETESESTEKPEDDCIRYESREISKVSMFLDSETDEESEEEFKARKVTRSRKSVNEKVSCQFCNTSFSFRCELRTHFIQEHEPEVTCDRCPKNFNYPQELQIHNELLHTEGSPVECRYCPDKPLIQPDDVGKHFRFKHCHRYAKYFPSKKSGQTKDETQFQCPICKCFCFSAAKLSDHMHIHTDDKPYKCKFCPMEFNMKRSFQSHLKLKHNAKGSVTMFQRDIQGSPCQFCQAIYPTKEELWQHFILEHTSEVTCDKCPKNFNFPKELELHNELVHAEDSPVQCRYCPEKMPIPRDDLANHFRLKHCHRYTKYFPTKKRSQNETPTQFQCLLCKRYFISAALLSDHMNVHTDNKPYKCKFCPMDFNMKRTFQAHLKRKHNVTGIAATFLRNNQGFPRSRRKEVEFPTPYQCEICGRYCPSASLLSDHLHCHADDKPYQCSHCSMRFNMKRTYQAHLRRKHDIKGDSTTEEMKAAKKKRIGENNLIECAECKETMPKNNLRRHKAWHDRQKNSNSFLCAFCPRLFNDKTTLKSHERKIHLNVKRVRKECTICNKKYDQCYLSTHMEKVHSDERKFVCNICGNTFKGQAQLDSHLKLHEERKFECSICHKKYIRQVDLTVHMRSHTGEQPYACHLCDKRFSIKVRLTYHLQKHAGVKHRCKDCGKEFNHIKLLRQHSYKHTGFPYRCPSCGYGCSLRDVFSRHLQRMHSISMTEDEYREMFKKNTGRMPRIPTIEELQKADGT